jgi:hypothetical protein
MIPFSVLDLSPVIEGGDVSQSLANTLDLARQAERLGYKRYWLAEHHNMPGIASAATAVVIGHVAAGTKTIRVGAGGIMLPNHAGGASSLPHRPRAGPCARHGPADRAGAQAQPRRRRRQLPAGRH